MLRVPHQGGDYTNILNKAFAEIDNVDGPRTIMLPNETVTIDHEVVVISDYVTLQGGKDTYVIGDGSLLLHACVGFSVKDIVFQDFDVGVKGPSVKVNIHDCDFLGTCLSLVGGDESPCMDVSIESCYFKECGTGIYAEGVVDGWVSKCSWEACEVGAEMVSFLEEEDHLSNYQCVRITYRDCRLRVPRGGVGFIADSGSPLILDSVRLDGAGDVASIGKCGKKYTHSLVRVWNNAGYVCMPAGLWVESSCCDHLRFKHDQAG